MKCVGLREAFGGHECMWVLVVSREHVWICSCLVVYIASVAQSVERTALNRTVTGCHPADTLLYKLLLLLLLLLVLMLLLLLTSLVMLLMMLLLVGVDVVVDVAGVWVGVDVVVDVADAVVADGVVDVGAANVIVFAAVYSGVVIDVVDVAVLNAVAVDIVVDGGHDVVFAVCC